MEVVVGMLLVTLTTLETSFAICFSWRFGRRKFPENYSNCILSMPLD